MKKIIAVLLSIFLLSCFVGNHTFAVDLSIDGYYYDSNAVEFEPTYFKFKFDYYGTYIWRVLDRNTGIYHNVTGDEEEARNISMDYNGCAIQGDTWYICADFCDESKPTVDGFTYFKFIFSDGTHIWIVLDRNTRKYYNVTGEEGVASLASMGYHRYAVRGLDRYDSLAMLNSIQKGNMLKRKHSF